MKPGFSISADEEIFEKVLGALRIWSGHQALMDIMERYRQLNVFLAGGVLRDLLLGRGTPPKDFDFFVDGVELPELLAQMAANGSVTYGPFGSPRWFIANERTYVDVIPIKGFYNGLSRCGDMVDVLKQFDFTANALAVDLRTGMFLDPIGARRDIEKRIMRGVRFDYPDEPISAGQAISRLSVLWFRLLHYAALCDLTVEPVTKRWLWSNRKYKRDLDTFTKLFFMPHPRSHLIYDA